MNQKWYEKNLVIILFLIFFFPVGLFLMWKYSRWNKAVKIVISIFFGLFLISRIGTTQKAATSTTSKTDTTIVQEKPKEKTAEVAKQKADEEAKAAKNNVPKEYQSALKTADTYANKMNLSKKGLYQQLTSNYGEKFPAEAAQYAVDNVKADWKKNALATAKTYQDNMNMSRSAIHDQLVSDYGGKFTEEEAQYAMDNLEN